MATFKEAIGEAFATPALYGLGAGATLVAAAVGTLLGIIFLFPMSLLAIIFFPMLFFWAALAALLAAPVTLLLFPLTAQLLRNHPILAQIAIPLLGTVAGYGIISGWIALGVLPSGGTNLFAPIGMISGLSGGGFFVRGLYA